MKNLHNSIGQAIDQVTSLKKKINQIDREHTYTFKELFNDEFMQAHTKYKNISSFLHDSCLDFSNQEAFRNIDESELDKYIFSHSDFESWHDMKLSATQEIISRQLKN